MAHFSIVEVEHAREKFQSRTNIEQNQFILDPSKSLVRRAFSKILQLCWKDNLSVGMHSSLPLESQERGIKSCFTNFLKGLHCSGEKESVELKLPKVAEAKAWMTYFFNRIGDHMPHVQKVHLPHFLTKKDVYFWMKTELVEKGLQEKHIISLSYFFKLWDKSFKDVVIPTVSSQLC